MVFFLGLIRKSILIFTLVLLSSCATVSNLTGQNDGVVFLKISSNNLASELYISEIYIEHTYDKKTYKLDGINYDCINCAAFSGGVPEGNYFISRLVLSCIGGCVGYEVNINDSFGRFDIKKSTVTNLGEVYFHENIQSQKMLLAHTLGENNHKTINNLIKQYFPQYIGFLDNHFLTWNYSLSDSNMSGILSDIRRSSKGYISWFELANGDVLFASALGKIKKWSLSTGSVSLDVDETSVASTFTQLKDGKVIVAGDEGLLKYSEDMGNTWVNINHDIPIGVISGIIEYGDAIYITLIHNKNISLYKGGLDTSSWSRVAFIKVSSLMDNGANKNVKAYLLKDEILIPSTNNYLFSFNVKTGDSKNYKMPGAVKDFNLSNGILYCLCNNGLLSDNFKSVDGMSWSKFNAPKMLGMPFFKNEAYGMGLERLSFSSPRLMSTENGGDTWKEVRRMNGFDGKLLGYVKSKDILLSVSNGGRLHYTTDSGVTWKNIE